MQDVDWNLALARLSFLHGYIRQMRKEISMKNENFHAEPREEARQAPASELRPPAWPAHRRFWRRAFHRTAPATPQATAPAVPRKERDARARGARCGGVMTEP